MMKALSAILGILAAVSMTAAPAVAAPSRFVPPGNSAVNQYTETIPTGGGNAKPGHRGKRSTADVIGRGKTRGLEAAGPSGHAVADLVAETAPPTLSSHAAPKRSGATKPSTAPDSAAPVSAG